MIVKKMTQQRSWHHKILEDPLSRAFSENRIIKSLFKSWRKFSGVNLQRPGNYLPTTTIPELVKSQLGK
jgi:hypothetical protein